jgi:hypothetical protein
MSSLQHDAYAFQPLHMLPCCALPALPLQHKALEAAVAKDSKDGAALAGSTFASLNKKLSEKFKHIEALNAKYQQVRQRHLRR